MVIRNNSIILIKERELDRDVNYVEQKIDNQFLELTGLKDFDGCEIYPQFENDYNSHNQTLKLKNNFRIIDVEVAKSEIVLNL